MTGRQILITVIATMVGFALGVMVPHTGSRPDPSKPNPSKVLHIKTGLGISDAPRMPTTRPRERPSKPDRDSSEPAIAIPIRAIAAGLRKRQFSYCDFTSISPRLDETLGILSAGDQSRAELLSRFASAKNRLLQEEQSHLKLTSATPELLTIDLSGMAGISQQIVSELRDSIRLLLPADQADVLDQSISWNQFYFSEGLQEISFKIERLPNGVLIARSNSGKGWSGVTLDSQQYSEMDDGIPAAPLFDPRWSAALGPARLKPVDQ